MYERPEVQCVTELAEGVFMASGAQEDVACPENKPSKE